MGAWEVSKTTKQDVDRFSTPLYSLREAAAYLGVPESTFGTWAKGYIWHSKGRRDVRAAPVVTALPDTRRGVAVVPFVGLAEGLVLAAIRRTGVPLRRIRPALEQLEKTLGIKHALASKALYSDGAEVLYDFADRRGDSPEARSARQLVVVRNGQHVFNEVVEDYLRRIEFAPDGYAQVIRLPQYDDADVVVDPRRGFGHPTFLHGGARVEDALSLFRAGESLATVSAEFGVPEQALEAAVRVATILPAA
jgi:uncharacterized protein (DUF433 family)